MTPGGWREGKLAWMSPDPGSSPALAFPVERPWAFASCPESPTLSGRAGTSFVGRAQMGRYGAYCGVLRRELSRYA